MAHQAYVCSTSTTLVFLDQPHLGIKTAAEVTVSYRLFVSMVSKKSTQRRHNRRLEAVHLCQHSLSSSTSAIAKQMGCRHGFVKRWVTRHQQLGHVRDSPRSGRLHKATAAAVQHVLMAAQLPECTSAADIAARTKQDLEVQLSRSSVTRILKRKGHAAPVTKGGAIADSHAEGCQDQVC